MRIVVMIRERFKQFNSRFTLICQYGAEGGLVYSQEGRYYVAVSRGCSGSGVIGGCLGEFSGILVLLGCVYVQAQISEYLLPFLHSHCTNQQRLANTAASMLADTSAVLAQSNTVGQRRREEGELQRRNTTWRGVQCL